MKRKGMFLNQITKYNPKHKIIQAKQIQHVDIGHKSKRPDLWPDLKEYEEAALDQATMKTDDKTL